MSYEYDKTNIKDMAIAILDERPVFAHEAILNDCYDVIDGKKLTQKQYDKIEEYYTDYLGA